MKSSLSCFPNTSFNLTTEVNALLALLCFHSSRFEARRDNQGNQILYQDQNPEDWNHELIQKGEYYLNVSGKEKTYSRYHIEAFIAFWHTRTNIDEQKKWQQILTLYDNLLTIENSPIITLNRTFALSKVKDKATALNEAKKIKLEGNPLYHSLMAELYTGIDKEQQIIELQKAMATSKNESDILHLQKKLDKAKKS